MRREIRMGIDVGGTHTKAVAIDNQTHEIIGRSIVKTSHDDPRGVAKGVINCFQNCLSENDIAPEDVVFIAHSTTQATNALLEGDVAYIGIVGIGPGGILGMLSKKQSNIPDIDLGTGRFIKTAHRYIKQKKMNIKTVEEVITQLCDEGAQVLVSSQTFGVDSMKEEEAVRDIAEGRNLMVSVASDISKLYGLTRRTRTAAINASILPKMMNTANSTEMAVRDAGVAVPLMIMRGDGGVMDIAEMKKRPVLTMLSGPAASVVGALMYLRASNGIYFEVGGTSTNIGVIKNGRPAVEYATVGGHQTYVNSLDVVVLGVAGGSMVRANQNGLIDVGPRSAHIGGMTYAAYTPLEKIVNPQLEFFAPREGDPEDYVRIKLADGTYVTLTNSCAANILGLVQKDDYSYGNVTAARRCMEPLADYLGISVEQCASQILQKSYEKIEPVIQEFAEKYKIAKDQISLVGCGGGASSLLPYTAKKMELQYSIPKDAEVISSIGVALAMIRDVVERVIPSPTAKDIADIKREARQLAIMSGAVPDSVEVQIQIDAQTSKITAIALGSNEVQTTDLLKACDETEACRLAAQSLNMTPQELSVTVQTDAFYVFEAIKNEVKQIRLVDKKGFIKVQRKNADAIRFPAKEWREKTAGLWQSMLTYKAEMERTPDLYLCIGGKVLDFEGTVSLEQQMILMESEFLDIDSHEEVILIGAQAELL